jgi:GTP-binding protein
VSLLHLAAVDGQSPRRQPEVLRRELASFNPDLAARPGLVVGSKADQLSPDDWGDDAPVEMALSAVTRDGIRPFLWRLSSMVREVRQADPEREAFVIHRPEPVGVAVVRDDDGGWRVVGRAAERAVALSDLTDPGALDYARNRLDKLGVNRALRRAGVLDGDTVRIATFEFDYESDL